MHCISTPTARLLSLFFVLWFSPLAAGEYIVKPGDTLTGIARNSLSPGNTIDSQQITQFINQVMNQNPLRFPQRNPHQLAIGMKLNLPDNKPISEPDPEPIIEATPQPEIKVAEKIIAQISQLKGSGWLLHDDESQEALYVGQGVKQGDSIRTAFESQAKIEFADQASLTVKQSSQINIEEYQWNEQTSSGRSIIEFLKGAFRAVSGLIAKSEPENFAVKSPVATIGIRGTDFGARFCARSICEIQTGADSMTLAQGLYVGVLDGQISSQSNGKETLVNAGEAIYQKDATSPVKPIKNLPGLIFSEAEINTYSPVPMTKIEPVKMKNIPFYQAFWRNSQGNVIKDSQGNCIRSDEYISDHYVTECQ